MNKTLLLIAYCIGCGTGYGAGYATIIDYKDCKPLVEASKEAINAAYMIGYKEGSHMDDIGLVRLTVKDVEGKI